MRILVSGSLAYDKIMDFPGYFRDHILADKIHNLNVSFLIKNLNTNFGGTAGNIAYNLSLLGEEPIILAASGNDFAKYQRWLKTKTINIDHIKKIKNQATATAHIITDQADNQITAFYPGAANHSNGEIKKKLLVDALAIIAPGSAIDMVGYAKTYRANKVPFIFDPGQQMTALSDAQLISCLMGAKIFISNDYELNLFCQKTRLMEKNILQNVEILITTLGEKGSVIKTKDKTYKIPSVKPQKVVDPTGAGDAYRAGLIKGLISGFSLPQIGRLASAIASRAVAHYGTQKHSFATK